MRQGVLPAFGRRPMPRVGRDQPYSMCWPLGGVLVDHQDQVPTSARSGGYYLYAYPVTALRSPLPKHRTVTVRGQLGFGEPPAHQDHHHATIRTGHPKE